ncbi:MAG: sigma-70 family RNA polymerase sigma factor [Cyclobacteriaceae bacterium]|nr:sigma-70 family RNA polymerase sigma factor [Cyclobacteriaceae bacterium]
MPQSRKFFEILHSADRSSPAKPTFSFEDLSDQEIWTMFKKGHVGAFHHIYITQYRHLYQYGHRICADTNLIKDCIQDLFLELRNGKKISDTQSIRFYLLKALKIKIQKAVQKRTKMQPLDQMLDQQGAFGIELSDEVKHIHLQIKEEQKQEVQRLLSKLTKQQREALYYFYFENMSYQEVADIMGFQHVRSARNLIYKALDSLKAYLKFGILLIMILFI